MQVNDVLGLTKDKDYNKNHIQDFNENNKAILEKLFEYRRYISDSDKKYFTNYEIAYPIPKSVVK